MSGGKLPHGTEHFKNMKNSLDFPRVVNFSVSVSFSRMYMLCLNFCCMQGAGVATQILIANVCLTLANSGCGGRCVCASAACACVCVCVLKCICV